MRSLYLVNFFGKEKFLAFARTSQLLIKECFVLQRHGS